MTEPLGWDLAKTQLELPIYWHISDLSGDLAAMTLTGNVRITDNAGNLVVPSNISDEALAFDVLLANAAIVPEPSALMLFGAGLAGIGFARRRRSA